MMSKSESFHEKWKSFLNETKANRENLSEVDAVGGISSALKGLAGPGQPASARLGGMRRYRRSKPGETEEDEETTALTRTQSVEELSPEEAAIVVRASAEIQKTSSAAEMTALLKSDFFVQLKKNNPEIYDLVVNSAPAEKISPVVVGLVSSMVSGSLKAVLAVFEGLKIKRSKALADGLNRITGFTSEDQRKRLFKLDSEAFLEEDVSNFSSSLERTTQIVLKLVKSQSNKHIIGSAIILYWQKVVNQNIYKLAEQEMNAAKVIAKIQTDWITNNMLKDAAKEKEKAQKTVKKMATNPDVKNALAKL